MKVNQKSLLLFFAMAIISSTKSFSQTLPDSIVKKIDNLFKGWDNANSPGCAVGIVRNDSLIFAKGYGMANLEYGVPISPETIFHMASVSKQFTAYSIVLLAKAGKLGLDDDIHKYLPWFPDLKEKITIRHLLNHTSGIRDQWQLLAIAGTRLDDVITQEHIVKVLGKQQSLNFKPGEQYSYSNSGFTMLAEIVRSVTGQSLRQFADSAIFKPLGMSNTHFHDDYTEIVKNRSYSYERNASFRFVNSILSYSNAGATSLFTNINDLSRWIMNFYDHKVGDQKDIDQLTQKGRLNNGKEINYAMGISVDIYRGWKQFSHSGGDAGYRTFVMVFPDLKTGFIVFSNLAEVSTFDKAYGLAEIFIADSVKNKVAETPKKTDTSMAILKDAAILKKFMGDYISEDGVQFSFLTDHEKLYWKTRSQTYLLMKAEKDTFSMAVNPEVKFVFSITPAKTTLVNEYWPDNNRLLTKYKADTAISDKQLQVYTGLYYCPELDCRYGIVIKDHHLVLTNNKYNDTPLTLAGADDLFCDFWCMSHLKVIRDKTNKITGWEVNNGRIMHLRFNKVE
jgi:CubicO group peptidase (beta-lactamase class C family)